MNHFSLFVKLSVVMAGILIFGMALTGCASSGKKCLQWTDVTVGRMPSGVALTERRCAQWESDAEYQKRIQKEKDDNY